MINVSKHKLKHEIFIAAHPEVEEWLLNRPLQTRRSFAGHLQMFCETMNIAPEEWRKLDKFEARDMAWKYVIPKIRESSTVAKADLVALKSWYRNRDGEQLPFDSSKGGKHYFHVRHKKRAKEHIPSKESMFQIIDMASSLRDKAVLLFIFQSGVRVNVLEHITYGAVNSQLDEDIVTLKITGELDYKLRNMSVPFYYTFLNGESSETLKRYCKVYHRDSSRDTPLFVTKTGKPVSQRWVWRIVKMCVERAGFDPSTVWVHTIRKAFRRQVRHAEVDIEFKEMLMGHVMEGSREAYFDRHDLHWFREQYQKINFGREASGSETARLRQEMEEKLQKKDDEIRGLQQKVNQISEGVELSSSQLNKIIEAVKAELKKEQTKG